METFLLWQRDLPAFLTACGHHRQVWIPVAADHPGHYRFAPLEETGPEAVALEYRRTLLPPKKLFSPPEETLFRYDADGFHPVDPPLRQRLLFGLHPCDLHGIAYADAFFTAPPHPDRTYRARRATTLLAGLGCIPDNHCFCASTGTQHIDGVYDLFLWQLDNRFLVLVRTEAGHGLIHLARPLFHPVDQGDRQAYLELLETRRKAFAVAMETADLPQILETQVESGVWEELSAACFACGACTMVCPTCTCYDLFDRPALDGVTGERVRRWDSCLFREFHRVAGERHLRPRRSDRVKTRFYHKEHDAARRTGRIACVGCGRCCTACPAGIHAVSVLRRLRAACAA